LISAVSALVLAILDGSNNAANAVSFAVGCRALSVRRALAIAALFDFLGASILGVLLLKFFTTSGIISVKSVDVRAAVVSLTASVVVVVIANYLRTPVSITLLVTGSLTASAFNDLGSAFITVVILLILWFLLIAVSASISYLVEKFRVNNAWKSFAAIPVLGLFYVNIVRRLNLDTGAFWTVLLVIFPMLLLVALYIATRNGLAVSVGLASLAHGMNDGALLTAVAIMTSNEPLNPEVFLVLVGLSLSAGIVLWGYKITRRMAFEIAVIDRDAAESSYTAMFASIAAFNMFGVPAPLTYAFLGSYLGVGLSRGTRYINRRVLATVLGSSIGLTLTLITVVTLIKLFAWV